MKLKNLIENLEKISKERGGNLEVIMADNIPVVSPVFSSKYPGGKKVIITDER